MSTCSNESVWIQAQHPHVAKCTVVLFQYQMVGFLLPRFSSLLCFCCQFWPNILTPVTAIADQDPMSLVDDQLHPVACRFHLNSLQNSVQRRLLMQCFFSTVDLIEPRVNDHLLAGIRCAHGAADADLQTLATHM